MTTAKKLEQAYRAVGQQVTVREIGPGYYEVIKLRSRQTISHGELCNEIMRLEEVDDR